MRLSRLVAMVVSIIGIASLVLGITLITQANSGKQQIANEIVPLKMSEVNAKYDAVKASLSKIQAAEEPNIQTGKAQPSAMYAYLSAQKVGLGLAKANIGTTKVVFTVGIIEIIIGFGLVLTGLILLRKPATVAQPSVLSISEMGHFMNRTLWHNQMVLASSLRFQL